MCADDGCDECLCCLCAPLAAIFCCKLCKDKANSNNVSQAPNNDIYQDIDRRGPQAGYYGQQGYGPPRMSNQGNIYPGNPQRQPVQHDYFPPLPPTQNQMRYDQSVPHVKHQQRPY